MLVLKWGPWSAAAALLAIGVAAGLQLPGPAAGSVAGRGLLLATGALPLVLELGTRALGRADRRPRRTAAGPVLPLAAGLAILWTGWALGVDGRGRSLARCAASLRSGDSVRADGRVAGWGVSASARGRRVARLRLEDVRIEADRGECRAGRLLVLVDGPAERRPAGRVAAAGSWWRYPGPTDRPRPDGRFGLVRADGPVAPLPEVGRAARDVGPARGAVRWLRQRARDRLSSRLAADAAPLGAALLLADRDGLSSDLRARFADAGLAHLLAVSGLHVGVVGGLILGLAGLLTRHRLRYPASAALTLAYVGWIGAPPSALRAGLLYAGWAWCRTRGSPTPVLELLAAAAVISVLLDPLVLLEVGFQLSFAGFFGLLVGLRLSVVLRAGGRAQAAPAGGPAAIFGAAAGAFLATAPLVALHFHRLAPVAAVSGLAATPLVAGAVPALAAAATLPDPAAIPAAHAATGLLRGLVWLAGRVADLPGGGRAVPPPGPWELAAALLLAAGVVRLAASGRWCRAVVPAAAAAAILLAGPGVAGWPGRGTARICAVDVGQGDAVAVRTAAGGWMLVDGGPGPPARDAGLEAVVPQLRRWGVRRVDVLVVTHPHLDHVGGLASVMDAFPVREIWDAATVTGSPAYRAVLEEAAARGSRWRAVEAGDRFSLDGVAGLVLGPARGGPAEDPNEASVVLRLTFPTGTAALLAGDAGPREEAWILERWSADRLRARILKVAHHGSRSSTSRRWLEVVRPRVALISAGEGNRYGHPHPGVLARLREVGAVRVHRTDREGTVCVDPD